MLLFCIFLLFFLFLLWANFQTHCFHRQKCTKYFRIRKVLIKTTAQKLKFSINDFFSKYDHIHSFLQRVEHQGVYFIYGFEQVLHGIGGIAPVEAKQGKARQFKIFLIFPTFLKSFILLFLVARPVSHIWCLFY